MKAATTGKAAGEIKHWPADPIVGWWPHGFGWGFAGLLGVQVSAVWHVGFLAEAGCASIGLGFVLLEVVYGE